MMNYGIFTQIYILQGFNAKEAKRVEKATKMAKAGKWKISRHNFTMSRKLVEVCCNKQNYVATKIKQSVRKQLKDCRDISQFCRDTI